MEPAVDRSRSLSHARDRARLRPELEQLQRDGYVILPELLSGDVADTASGEMARINAESAHGANEFAGRTTVRAYNLIARTRALDPLILHPDVLALVESHLGDDVQLSIATGITQEPGAPAQALHRDDGVYPIARPHPPLSVTVMWALDEFTERNGATVLCPGSQDGSQGKEPVQAAMPRGSVLFWDGGTLHGSGENRGELPRIGVTAIYSVAWLRQYENQYLSVPRDVVRELPAAYQALLGFRVVHFTLGLYEGRSPRRALEE